MGPSLQIGIVGCGIAGTASALMLARARHAVSLFEQTASVGPVGAGVLLQPSGQRVLANLGLMDGLWPHVERIDEIHAITHRGGDLVRLRYADYRPGLCGVGLHRGDLFTLLHGELDHAGVQLHLGTTIESVQSLDRRPTLIDTGGHSYGPFDLVIAADGSRSRLREACGLQARVIEYAYGALWAVCDIAPIRGQLLQATHGTGQLSGILPIGGGRCSLFWGVRRDRVESLIQRGFGPWREEAVKLMPDAGPLIDRVGSLEAMRFVSYRHICMRRARRERVIFIGDAAHAMSPHLGQGVNLALQDAEALSQSIAQTSSIEQAFNRYDQTRQARVRLYAGITAFLSPFFQGNWNVLAMGRDVALPLMCKFGPTRRAMLRVMCGVD